MSEKTANPAPLGLLGFGLTTVLLNFVYNAQNAPAVDVMILAMGIAYGGVAQIIAGSMEFKRGNTFGTVAFTSYGLFWWSFVILVLLPELSSTPPPSSLALGAYFFMWGLFTFGMFFATLKKNRALQLVFISLTILFFLLAIKFALLTYNSTLDMSLFTRITGVEGIICGLSAVYLAIAEVLNETYEKTVLPIGTVS
jgi:hypothetical protein